MEGWLPSHDALTIMFMSLIFAAGIVAALMVMRGGSESLLQAVGLVAVGVLAWTWFNVSSAREQAAERRALEARLTELTAQAMAPGSPLACLDDTGLETVDAACGRALFANSQTVAAAVAYTSARLSLLEDGLAFAARDKGYAPVADRLRRVLAADRYGVVAHVLATRGCTADECPAFALFADPSKLKANLKDRSFALSVAHYAANWRSDGASSPVAAAAPSSETPAPSPPSAALTAGQTSVPTGVPLDPKYTLPSAASIPPVSIMASEPSGPAPPAVTGTATPQPKRQAPKRPPAKQQSALPPPPPGTISNPAPPAAQ
jgi:hypothetical protein